MRISPIGRIRLWGHTVSMEDAICTTKQVEAPPEARLWLGYVTKTLAQLHPAYFALVMATGIVSLDCHLLGLEEFARFLFLVNVAAYSILLVLYLSRLALFTSNFIEDCFSHKRAFGFFTIVAATNVLGSQFSQLAGNMAVAQALWWLSLVFWLACTYSIFVFLVVKREKPSFEDGINGGWLVAVVATQSMCVLGTQVRPQLFAHPDLSVLLLFSFWLFGGMLYIWLISLIFYRYMFFRFEPSDLIPPYWINMGAMAISTLAGAELVNRFGGLHPITEMLPFVKGLTLFYWATATWWIPMLFGLFAWRHLVRRFKFTYDPLYWGLVFPLGMYSVCTLRLAAAIDVLALSGLARIFLIFALVAWLLTFLSMGQRLVYPVVLALRVVKFICFGGMKDDSARK